MAALPYERLCGDMLPRDADRHKDRFGSAPQEAGTSRRWHGDFDGHSA
jgi:hypothetical protein